MSKYKQRLLEALSGRDEAIVLPSHGDAKNCRRALRRLLVASGLQDTYTTKVQGNVLTIQPVRMILISRDLT